MDAPPPTADAPRPDSPLPDAAALAALAVPEACRAGVAANLALLAGHWRQFAEVDA